MKIEIHLHQDKTYMEVLHSINLKLGEIMSVQDDLAQALNNLTVHVDKIGVETAATVQKVADLQAALDAGGSVSPAVQAALDNLTAHVRIVDDMVPDAANAAPPAPVPAPTPAPADTPAPAPADVPPPAP